MEDRGHSETVNIVRVDKDRIPDLLALCRENFPDSLWWFGPRPAGRAWWTRMLSAPSSEVYIMYVDRRPAGFFLIVSDLRAFSARMNRISPRERVLFGMRYFGLILCPRLILSSVRKWLKKAERRAYVSWHDKIAPERVAWGDLHAISPDYRRAGLAKQFMHFVEQRTLELGKDAFLGNVEPGNFKVIRMLESIGYRQMGQTDSGLVYGKVLRGDR